MDTLENNLGSPVYPGYIDNFLIRSWSALLSELQQLQVYSNWYFQAVSHWKTNQAQSCLASEIRRAGRVQGGVSYHYLL